MTVLILSGPSYAESTEAVRSGWESIYLSESYSAANRARQCQNPSDAAEWRTSETLFLQAVTSVTRPLITPHVAPTPQTAPSVNAINKGRIAANDRRMALLALYRDKFNEMALSARRQAANARSDGYRASADARDREALKWYATGTSMGLGILPLPAEAESDLTRVRVEATKQAQIDEFAAAQEETRAKLLANRESSEAIETIAGNPMSAKSRREKFIAASYESGLLKAYNFQRREVQIRSAAWKLLDLDLKRDVIATFAFLAEFELGTKRGFEVIDSRSGKKLASYDLIWGIEIYP